MIPDPENGETSSKSNPARRFLSPFTEDRIRSGQVWLAPHLSLSLQKRRCGSDKLERPTLEAYAEDTCELCLQGGGKQKVKFGLPLAYHYLCRR